MTMVTIIMPIFNGRKYLDYSLKSVFAQSFKDFELLLIDDGSTDNTLQYLHEMLKPEGMEIRIFHQENRGIAQTRNYGISCAKGEFLMFMDQDDVLDSDYVEMLVKTIAHSEADIVVSGYRRGALEAKKRKTVRLKDTEWSKFLNVAPWGKIFRTEFVVKNNLHFLDVVKGEDCYFTVYAYALAKKVEIIPYVGYNWIDNQKSVTNTVYVNVSQDSSIGIMLERLDAELKGTQMKISQELLEYYYVKSIIYDLLFSTKRARKEDISSLYSDLFGWLGSVCPEYRNNPYISCWKPEGERLFTRIVVFVFMTLHKMKMGEIFLQLYSKI